MILTLKGKLKKGKVLAMRPNLSVRVLNWDEVHFLAGKRGFFRTHVYQERIDRSDCFETFANRIEFEDYNVV